MIVIILNSIARNTPYSTMKKRIMYLFYCENNYCSINWTVFRSSVESNSFGIAESCSNLKSSITTDDWLQSAGIDINTLITNQNIQSDLKRIGHTTINRKLTQKSYLINYMSESDIDNNDSKIKFLLNTYISNVDNDPIEIKKSSDSDVSSDKSGIEYLDPSSVEESCYISDKDKYLHNFSAEISKFPRQIIRYCFGGTPLYSETPKKINVPTCKECGSNKVYEFQIISTIIYEWENLFGEKDVFDKCNSDWSTIIIYTCSKDCNVEFFEESIILQYFEPESNKDYLNVN
ncbi:programmed cell death [Cryptosporidium sp. chipmunk genotype I]|uniref:programmed cell death n=1 Tax=Cryptosporidium sp. chipmunk genotype I TaxID=1280935 RepID=UPI00351A89A6|nr:programmed cell death [Cryptosporidium sp. chipmunk genotype I]